MQSRKTLEIEVLVVLLGLGVLLYFKFFREPKLLTPPNTNQAVERAIDQSLYTITPIQEETDYTLIDAQYPVFPEADINFNQKIKDYVTQKITEHKNITEENWKARYATSLPEENFPEKPAEKKQKMPLIITLEPVQINKRFISFLLRYEAYQGGAHGTVITTSFNYDVANKKELMLKELFNNDPLYLEDISRFTRSDLKKQLINTATLNDLGLTHDTQDRYVEDMTNGILAGTTPDEKNFQTFTFSDKAITFYFQDYQVGPHSIGMPRVTMPRK